MAHVAGLIFTQKLTQKCIPSLSTYVLLFVSFTHSSLWFEFESEI